jgi:hypothetical protein
VPDSPPQGDRAPRPRLSRRLRAGIVAAIVAIVAIDAYLLLRSSDESFSYDGPEAPAFSFSYDELERIRPRGEDELVRLEKVSRGGEFEAQLTVQPLSFEASDEPVGGTLPLAADRFTARAKRELPGYRLLEEGRTRLEVAHGIEAYQLGFVAKTPAYPGSILVGKTYLIPEEGKRVDRGVALTIEQRTRDRKTLDAVREAPAGFFLNWPIRFWLQLATAVDEHTPLEEPLKSFAFE